MIRVTLLTLFVSGLIVYAWRDWFKALCGLILLMAVMEHPDMPKSLLGIQGLNVFNIVLLAIVVCWLLHRKREGLTWDMPKGITWLLVFYGVVLGVSFLRMVFDLGGMREWASIQGSSEPSFMSLFSEDVINCYKWVIPGLLLFDGARDEKRLRWALAATLAVYVLLALQVIRWMPFENLTSGAALEERSQKILANEVGFHRVNMSMMLAGASWALLAARLAVPSRLLAFGVGGLAMLALLGQALTGGRAGYVTWGLIGTCMAWLKWRRYFVFGPVLVLIVAATVPAARERFMMGFNEETIDTNTRLADTVASEGEGPHWYTITAGRVVAWPYVLEKIAESPVVGYGREAMQRTGISSRLFLDYGEGFPHPHNAYLEFALDNGLLALLFVGILYFTIVRRSAWLFRHSSNPLHAAVGGAALALTLALLFAGLGSQSFYPREGAVGMWCAIGLMLRVYLMRESATVGSTAVEVAKPRGKLPWRTPAVEPSPQPAWRRSSGPWRKSTTA